MINCLFHRFYQNFIYGIILFKVRYNDEREDRLEDLYQWIKDQGYEYEDPIYEEDDDDSII